VLREKEVEVNVLEKLGFAKCRLSIATPKGSSYTDITFLDNKKIATSYPNTLSKYLSANNIHATIHLISGSVEIAPNIGLADAICDLVSSGSTLFKNGLEENEILITSEAVLAVNKESHKVKKELVDALTFRIQAVLKARKSKYILFNIPNDKIAMVSKLLPGLKSPSIIPLIEPGWSSLHSVIGENEFWKIIDELKNAGAEGILVLPIEKMIY
jgi:ATP phosphoribosyltransferase